MVGRIENRFVKRVLNRGLKESLELERRDRDDKLPPAPRLSCRRRRRRRLSSRECGL